MAENYHLPIQFVGLVEKLSNASGVSGAEGSVRAIVREALDDLKMTYRVDALGNVLVERSCGKPNAFRLMLASHMDEVGLMIVEEEEGGLYKFVIVGGIDPRVLPGKTVLVGKNRLPAIIGAKPIHLTDADERKNPITVENPRIDLGPGGAGKTKPGDRAVFSTEFRTNGHSFSGPPGSGHPFNASGKPTQECRPARCLHHTGRDRAARRESRRVCHESGCGHCRRCYTRPRPAFMER